jgi:hypothetical protein
MVRLVLGNKLPKVAQGLPKVVIGRVITVLRHKALREGRLPPKIPALLLQLMMILL